MSYLDDVKEKRQTIQGDRQQHIDRHHTRQQTQDDIDSLIKELKEVQVASLLGNNQKPSILLTDSTDLGEHISKLGNKIVEVLEAVRNDKSTTEQIERITSLTNEYKNVTLASQKAAKDQADRVVKAIDGLKSAVQQQKPVVVPAPAVRLTEKAVDFAPLITKIDELLTPKRDIDLTRYRAQDLDNSGELQYIGLTDASGSWYIMENNTEKNTIRYYFGLGGYEQAWDERYGHDYAVLSEAINAVRS